MYIFHWLTPSGGYPEGLRSVKRSSSFLKPGYPPSPDLALRKQMCYTKGVDKMSANTFRRFQWNGSI